MPDELKPQASVDTPEFRKLIIAVRHCSYRFDGTQPEMSALIAHIHAWGTRLASVPAGYKIAPIESTAEMNILGRRALRNCGNDQASIRDTELCWSAMIGATPAGNDV